MEVDVKKMRESKGLTQQGLADLLGVHINTVQNWESGKKIPNTKYPILCKMLNEMESKVEISHFSHSNVATGQGQININGMQQPDDQEQPEEDLVPVIPTNLYKEADVNIVEYIQDVDNVVQMSPAVQQFPKTDMFYTVQTMAMYPHLHQGDILALKALKKRTPIVNGELYAVDTVDLGILVRFIYDRGDKIELKGSEKSDRFESFFINKDDIYNYFRVVGLIRTNI